MNEDKCIKPGDVVYLKSGSFPMTVADVEDCRAHCYFASFRDFAREGAGIGPCLFDGYVPLAALTKENTA